MNRIAVTACIAIGAAAVAFTGLSAAAGQSGPRTFSWAGDSLSIATPGQVTFTQSPTARIVVSGPADAVSRVYVEGNRIGYNHKGLNWWRSWRHTEGLRIDVSGPHLRRLAAHAGTDLDIRDLHEDILSLSVHSGADVNARANLRILSAQVHSGADLSASGRADRLDLSVHSGGDAHLGDFIADHVQVRVHSGADAIVNPRLSADAAAHSGGDIRLVSRPANLHTQRHSGGDIRIP